MTVVQLRKALAARNLPEKVPTDRAKRQIPAHSRSLHNDYTSRLLYACARSWLGRNSYTHLDAAAPTSDTLYASRFDHECYKLASVCINCHEATSCDAAGSEGGPRLASDRSAQSRGTSTERPSGRNRSCPAIQRAGHTHAHGGRTCSPKSQGTRP